MELATAAIRKIAIGMARIRLLLIAAAQVVSAPQESSLKRYSQSRENRNRQGTCRNRRPCRTPCLHGCRPCSRGWLEFFNEILAYWVEDIQHYKRLITNTSVAMRNTALPAYTMPIRSCGWACTGTVWPGNVALRTIIIFSPWRPVMIVVSSPGFSGGAKRRPLQPVGS